MMAFGLMQILMIVLMGSGGGGNELLSYVTTEAYWQHRGVKVMDVQSLQPRLSDPAEADISRQLENLGSSMARVREAAGQEILAKGNAALPQLEKAARGSNADVAARAQELIDALGTQAQMIKVDRLMAIRALGETGDTAALPLLEPLLKSDALFEAEYARLAVARIKGQRYDAPTLQAETRMSDVWLLPADIGAVAQATMPAEGQLDVAALLDKMPAMPMMEEGQMTPEMRKAMVAQYHDAFMKLAGRLGNVRVDGVTLGVADNVGNDTGYAMFVIRGLYDIAAARAALTEMGVPRETISEVETFSTRELRYIPFSKDRFVILCGPNREALPVATVIEALKTGKGKLADNQAIAKLIKTVDTTSEQWAVMNVSAAYRVAPPLAPFDTLTMSSAKNGKTTTITINAKGSDQEAIARNVATMQGQIAMGIGEIKEQMADTPAMAPMMAPTLKIMESIELKAAGDGATLKVQVEGNVTHSLLMPFMGFGMMF